MKFKFHEKKWEMTSIIEISEYLIKKKEKNEEIREENNLK